MINNIGVLEGPKNYAKTPVTDAINRQAQIVPRTTIPAGQGNAFQLPKSTNNKILTSGDISAACVAGSLITAGVLLISRLIKLIKHK